MAEAKALACRLPAESAVPLARWSCPELATELTTRGITDAISASPVRRRLAEDAFKPWRHRSWILIAEPDWGRGQGAGEAGPGISEDRGLGEVFAVYCLPSETLPIPEDVAAAMAVRSARLSRQRDDLPALLAGNRTWEWVNPAVR